MLPVPEIVSWPALRECAAGDPVVRLLAGPGSTGYRSADAVAWRTPRPDDGVVCVRGRGATRLLDGLLSHGLLLRDGDRVRMPAGVPAALPHVEDWTLLTTSGSGPPSSRVTEVPAGQAAPLVRAVLGPEVRAAAGHLAWLGVRVAGRLLAVGEARSQNGVGHLARICVRPECRGRGLGAELTTTMTARLLGDHPSVALGVRTDNPRARALYERLGFHAVAGFSSYVARLAATCDPAREER